MKKGGFLLGKDKDLQKNKKKQAEEEEIINPCIKCGEHNCIDGEDYCEKCMSQMLNTRISFAGWVAGAASLMLSVVAIALIFMHFPCAVLEVRAESAVKDSRWMDACHYYEEMDNTIAELQATFEWKQGKAEPLMRRFFLMGTNTRAKMFEAYAEMYNPMTAVQELMVKDYSDYDSMVKGEEKLINHPLVKPYWEVYDSISFTEGTIYYSEEQPEESTYEASIAFIEKIEKQDGIDRVYSAYQKYAIAVSYGQPVEVRVKWLSECDKQAKASGRDYRWLYYYDYADVLNEQGRADEALSLIDMLISENKNNFNAYIQKTDILLANGRVADAEKFVTALGEEYGNYTETVEMQLKVSRCKGDYEKAKLIGDVLFSDYSASPETYRQLALIYLAEGDYSAAFEYTDIACTNAYNLNYYGAGVSEEKLYETLYVASKLLEKSGVLTDEEKVKVSQINEMFGEEYVPGADAKAIINGEKTAKEILMQGDYDLI